MQRWAEIVSKTAWLWAVAWPLLAIVIWSTSPRLPTLLEDDDTGFIPPDRPSRLAYAVLKREFPEHAPASRAAVVFARETGLTSEDHALIALIARALADRTDDLDWQVQSAALSPFLQPILESGNGKSAVIVVNLPAEMLTHSTVKRVRAIQDVIAQHDHDANLQVEITGVAAMGELADATVKQDVDRTTIWAFVGVALILLLIYRSPAAMLLPITAIAMSLMVSLGLIGLAAQFGMPINGLVEMFIVVIVVGSGVDYCLFLFARFGEEAKRGVDARTAVRAALCRTGPAILASGGTNIVGLGTLALASNRNLYTSGPAIAFSIFMATFAVLTIVPSLMYILGDRLFWPVSPRRQSAGNGAFWNWVGRLATRRPIGIIVVVIAAMVIPILVTAQAQPLYDDLREFPKDSSLVRGAQLYNRHFFDSTGISEPTIILSSDQDWKTPIEVEAYQGMLDAIHSALSQRFDLVFQRDIADPLGRTRQAALGEESSALGAAMVMFGKQAARDYYVSASGRAMRIDLGLAVAAQSNEAMNMMVDLRKIIADAVAQSGAVALNGGPIQIHIAGDTAMYADVRDLGNHDFRVVAVAAIIAVGLILLLLVRSVAQTMVLLGGTLLSYGVAYGTTDLLFEAFYGVSGLNWQIDFLLFIVILSLGQDYNIYVVTRIREELKHRPPRDAVMTAVARTGRVVSSCGVIMAAAFAATFTGSLLLMKEFAVALAIGVLIDTFIVRPLLVPALILLILQRKNRVPTDRHNSCEPIAQGASIREG